MTTTKTTNSIFHRDTPTTGSNNNTNKPDDDSSWTTTTTTTTTTTPGVVASTLVADSRKMAFTVETCVDMMYTTISDNNDNDIVDNDLNNDLPNYLRAASSMQWINETRIAILQDDLSYIALVDIIIHADDEDDQQQQKTTTTFIKDAYGIPLPAATHYHYRQFSERRGNRQLKFDLEASIYVPARHSPFKKEKEEGFLLAFGSGSSTTKHVRDVIFLLRDSLLLQTPPMFVSKDVDHRKWNVFQAVNHTFWENYCGEELSSSSFTTTKQQQQQVVVAFYAPALYDSLRNQTDFSGSELNLEGAAFIPPRTRFEPAKIRFFQRGNGAPKNGLYPKSATGEMVLKDLFRYMDYLLVADGQEPLFYPPSEGGNIYLQQDPPLIQDIVEYNLGSIGGVDLTFTGAAPAILNIHEDVENTEFIYIAGAEASPDATNDGDVKGTAMGIIHSIDFIQTTTMTTTNDDHDNNDQKQHQNQEDDYERGSYNFLTYPNGTKFLYKTEGVVTIPPPIADRPSFAIYKKNKNDKLALTVLDMDDPDIPSQMCVVRMQVN